MRQLHVILFLLISSFAIHAQNSGQSSDTVKQPKVVEAVAPDYPDEAIEMRAEGRVVVAVEVSQKGTVDSAKALYGPAMFAQPALDAARRWRFVESKNRKERIVELAFTFLITDKPVDNNVSFFPPNQIEVVMSAPRRAAGWASPRAGEDDENPEVIKSVAPVYPPIAMMARASGSVAVEVRIDEEGKVIAAAAISGHPLLQLIAVAAARRWEFASGRKKERSVRLSFVFNADVVEKDAGTSFVSPYQVEIKPPPSRIISQRN